MEAAIQSVAESSGNRRYRTVEERRRIVEETLAEGVSVAVVARRHGVNANQVFQWRKLTSSATSAEGLRGSFDLSRPRGHRSAQAPVQAAFGLFLKSLAVQSIQLGAFVPPDPQELDPDCLRDRVSRFLQREFQVKPSNEDMDGSADN